MNRTRKKVSKILVLLMLGCGLVNSYSTSTVLADNPNEHSSYHSLTGGWDRVISTIGKHWTSFSLRYSQGQVYASIQLQGYQRESKMGNYKTAYVKSSRSVDEFHTHYHSGGEAK